LKKNFIKIAFNLPIDKLFTYSIPDGIGESVVIGARVLAPFGKRNLTGIALEFTEESGVKSIKPIIKVLDAEPILTDEVIKFCKWISKYYYCPIGEVIFSALPRGILVESKITYSVTEGASGDGMKLNETQDTILDALESGALTLRQIERKLGQKNARSAVQTLLKAGLISQELLTSGEKSKAKFEKIVKFPLLDEFKGFTKENLDIFFTENKIKSLPQKEALSYLIQKNVSEIPLSELIRKSFSSSNAVVALAKKELVTIETRRASREAEHEFAKEAMILELNSEQKSVLGEIEASLLKQEFKPFLLFGVTGSGKTQVYIEAIRKVISTGKTAIVLVPEISLTPQLIHRFVTHFGSIIGVMHSRLTDGQRFDVFSRIKSGVIKIVIGARSALFAPLDLIGIIIVDEEHDHSYKQTEKNPKYNARDSAIIRAKNNDAVVVLGSATPSLESFYNAKTGKYHLLELPHRAMGTKQPQVEIVDMLGELRSTSKFIKYETPEKRFLSSRLISYIDSALKKKQAIILLQNRRGYSAYIECQKCGYVKMCVNCDITLIYHKMKNHLRCHYCGYTDALPEKCEVCGSDDLLLKGTGTEKVEEEIARLFPKARLRRMDADTVRGRDAHRKILKAFHEGEFEILIGTQMISKGLDFPNVFLVGVISADVGLLNPDFRSPEKTFQLLMQVAGRSGRASDYGKVVIQTMHPDNYIFPFVTESDYLSFYEKEINIRKNFNYPPFSRMSLIEISGSEPAKTASAASKIFLQLKEGLKRSGKQETGVEIMKPAPALLYKVKNKYRYHIIIKSLKQINDSLAVSESLLGNLNNILLRMNISPSMRVSVDVDPLSFY